MKLLLTYLLLIFPIIAGANSLPTFKIDQTHSTLTFKATQNGTPLEGQFKNFTGTLLFDPAKLKESKVEITVAMDSLAGDYDELLTTLKTAEWFDSGVFPKATFKSTSITNIKDNLYQASGLLTIRDHTTPVIFNFTLDKYSSKELTAHGGTVIKRLDFQIGQGEWSNVSEIKNEVAVNFTLTATH
jgi:polyisoprenoid-binding protein YceI